MLKSIAAAALVATCFPLSWSSERTRCSRDCSRGISFKAASLPIMLSSPARPVSPWSRDILCVALVLALPRATPLGMCSGSLSSAK